MINLEKSKKVYISHKIYINITLSINNKLQFDVWIKSIEQEIKIKKFLQKVPSLLKEKVKEIPSIPSKSSFTFFFEGRIEGNWRKVGTLVVPLKC